MYRFEETQAEQYQVGFERNLEIRLKTIAMNRLPNSCDLPEL
jgi:hypothetical protein